MEKSSLDILPDISICIQWKKKISLNFHCWVIFSFNRNITCILDYLNKHEQDIHTQVEEKQGYLEAMPSFKTSSYFSVDKIEKSEQVHILAAVAARDQNAKSCREWQTTNTQVIPVGTINVTLQGLGIGQSTRQTSSDQSCCLIGQVSHHWGGGATTTYHITSELFKWGSAILYASQL